MSEAGGWYDAAYGGFALDARARVRQETYGEDIGSNGWMTADELRLFIDRLGLDHASRVLDVACGSGGPSLFIAHSTGARVTGVDVNEAAVSTAGQAARERGLEGLADFHVVDAGAPLPFETGSFDAVLCIDAINHLPGRGAVLEDWCRLLRPGGRLLFTDPIVVSGLLTNEEIATRSSIGFFIFSLAEEDERLIAEAGLELLRREDVTDAVADVSGRWVASRERHREALVEDEGDGAYEDFQRFLETVHTLARARRLSRFAFLARKPGG